ncbi:hypothetical protein D3C76_1571410 [compost metagenome]
MFGVGQALLGLGQGGRVQAFDQLDSAIEVTQQARRYPRRIDQQACTRRYGAQGVGHFAVVAQGHAVLLQDRTQLRIDLA